jgi:hypothetical protein
VLESTFLFQHPSEAPLSDRPTIRVEGGAEELVFPPLKTPPKTTV